MTKEAKNRIEQSLKRADEALAKDRKGAMSKALETVTGADNPKAIPAPAEVEVVAQAVAKAPKGKKGKKSDKLAASRIEVDITGFVASMGKKPGTGKREKDPVWRFQIGPEVKEIAKAFYREAKAEAVRIAIEANVQSVTVLA